MAGTASAPQPAAAYRLVAADELGVLKVVEVPAGPKWDAAAVVSQWGTADKRAAVQRLACSAASLEPGTPALLAVGRKGGRVDILDAYTGAQQCSLTAAAAGGKSKPASTTAVVALEYVPAVDSRPLQLLVGTSDGMVTICSSSSSSSGGGGGESSGEADAAGAGPSSSSSSSWSVSTSFAVGSTLSCLAVDAAGSHIVVGGEGMQPSIWDLSTGSKVWQGKGGKPNRVGLVDKPYTTALAFLPSSDEATAANGHAEAAAARAAEAGASGQDEDRGESISRRFVAGSATAKLHVYDTAAGKRPQQEAVFGESRITAVAVEPDGRRVWAASGTGHMQLWVLKTNKFMDALKGAGGSVRTLARYPGPEPWLASVGLDRFLRVHDASTKAAKGRVYLKQQLTSVVWLPVQQPAAPAAAAAEGGVAAEAAAGVGAGPSSSKKKKSKSKGSKHRHDGAEGEEGEGAAAAAAEVKQNKKRRKQEA